MNVNTEIPTLEDPKAPAAVDAFFVDWSRALVSDTIAASVWVVAAGITKASDTFSDTVTTIWLSGGQQGQKYRITNRITTAAGAVDDKSFYVWVRQT